MNEQRPDATMTRVTEEDRKDNKEPEPASPGCCSQAINNKTVATDASDTMLNKINSISWVGSLRGLVRRIRKLRIESTFRVTKCPKNSNIPEYVKCLPYGRFIFEMNIFQIFYSLKSLEKVLR